MTYLILKYLHVLGAIVLIGTGIGIAFFMLMAHRTGDPAQVAGSAAAVVRADGVFTASAMVAQPVTGALLLHQSGTPVTEGWVLWSVALFALVAAFWLPVVWMQVRMRDLARQAAAAGSSLPTPYHRLFGTWFVFGFPGLGGVLGILWLMLAKPAL